MSRRGWVLVSSAAAAVLIVWIAVRVFVSSATVSPSAHKSPADAVRDADITVRDLDGRPVSTRDWRGRVTIVNFWATWCPPCRTEIPDLVALQQQYRGQVQIIGVSVDHGSGDQVRQFVREYRINYPVLMNDTRITSLFPPFSGLPASFVLDREAKIVDQYMGRMSRSTYEAEIRRLIDLSDVSGKRD